MTEPNSNESLPTTAPDCFCDLVPLYALGVLDDTEQAWVEQQMLDYPELATELAAYEMAVTAMAYGIETLPPSGQMETIKGKLFDRLGLDLAAVEPVPEPVLREPMSNFVPFLTTRSADLQWTSPGIPKVEIAILHTDPITRERVGLLRAQPGMQYPPHRHGGTEEIYMLSGDLVLEGETYYTGDYIRSAPGSKHGPAYSAAGCMFFFRSSMDDEYSIVAWLKQRIGQWFE
jgi:quercetin dioxygenase-like cupin family protein